MPFSRTDRRLNPREGNHGLGNGPFLLLWKAINKLERKWAGLKVDGGRIETRGDVTRIIVGRESPPSFNTTAYIYGEAKTLSPAATDKWIVVNLATGNITYSTDTSAPNPFPANEEWYEIANTVGTIRIVNH